MISQMKMENENKQNGYAAKKINLLVMRLKIIHILLKSEKIYAYYNRKSLFPKAQFIGNIGTEKIIYPCSKQLKNSLTASLIAHTIFDYVQLNQTVHKYNYIAHLAPESIYDDVRGARVRNEARNGSQSQKPQF